ncbi:MAG TPA: PQQ-dependent sugar dehydrogenase, partial [Planctomycetota bacterium]|nr:PQQ-dependent sugar dehydrogenase [Planctomycetota bacterium]
DGKIRRVKIDGSFAWGDMGTIGMALDPKFLENRRFYVWYADKPDKNVALDRFEWRDRTSETAGTRVNVITFSRREPPAPYHMGGVVKFLPDGTLLIGTGDAERPELSQDRKDLNGKLLRIRPKDEGGYEVPTDNPHVGDAAWRPEIVAHGLRAPFRAHLRDGKHLYFGDVGAVYEEIDLWKGGAVDFGWGHGVVSDGPTQPEGTVKPLVSWSQNRDFAAEDPDYNGETRLSAGVGPIYEGFSQDRYDGFLTGKLIFFDVMRGWIRAADLDAEGNVAGHRHVGHRQFISDMILGRDGYLYGVTWCRTESIFRLRLSHEIKPGPKAPPPTPIDEPPRPEGAAGTK